MHVVTVVSVLRIVGRGPYKAKKRHCNVALLQIWMKPVHQEGRKEVFAWQQGRREAAHLPLSLLKDWFFPNLQQCNITMPLFRLVCTPTTTARLSPRRLRSPVASLCGQSMLGQQVEAKTDDPPYIGRQTANANVSVKDGLQNPKIK